MNEREVVFTSEHAISAHPEITDFRARKLVGEIKAEVYGLFYGLHYGDEVQYEDGSISGGVPVVPILTDVFTSEFAKTPSDHDIHIEEFIEAVEYYNVQQFRREMGGDGQEIIKASRDQTIAFGILYEASRTDPQNKTEMEHMIDTVAHARENLQGTPYEAYIHDVEGIEPDEVARIEEASQVIDLIPEGSFKDQAISYLVEMVDRSNRGQVLLRDVLRERGVGEHEFDKMTKPLIGQSLFATRSRHKRGLVTISEAVLTVLYFDARTQAMSKPTFPRDSRNAIRDISIKLLDRLGSAYVERQRAMATRESEYDLEF